MPKADFSRATESEFIDRLNNLRANSPAVFGTMDTTRMMRHMRTSFETAVGETDLPDSSIPVLRGVIFFLITRLITTWPGGRLKAPDYWSPSAEHSFEEEKRLLVEVIGRFLAALDADPERRSRHPIFGPLTLRQWSRLSGLHMHHHLRQFSV